MTHPVVFHRDVAHALNGICGDVREKWITGECDDIEVIVAEVVSKMPSWNRHVLEGCLRIPRTLSVMC